MKGQANWSPMQKLLFTSLVPIAAAVGTLLLFSYLRSQPNPAPQAESSFSLTAEPSAAISRRGEREAFRDCLRGMGVDIGGTGLQSRYATRPSAKKIQEAMSVCRIVLETDSSPPPTPRTQTAPPIA